MITVHEMQINYRKKYLCGDSVDIACKSDRSNQSISILYLCKWTEHRKTFMHFLNSVSKEVIITYLILNNNSVWVNAILQFDKGFTYLLQQYYW